MYSLAISPDNKPKRMRKGISEMFKVSFPTMSKGEKPIIEQNMIYPVMLAISAGYNTLSSIPSCS